MPGTKTMAIQANELRIGNLIQSNFPTKKIYTVNGMFIQQVSHLPNMETSNYEPIPLSKERLMDLGLKRDDSYSFSDSFYFIELGISTLHINPNNGVVWITGPNTMFNNPQLIYYVHQLQNLHFALTGKELAL